jgi:tetratricopeptide (TPR) repeat protein
MESELGNHVVTLCAEGWAAEHEGRIDDARALYQRAWDERADEYEACIAAHYLARVQERREERLHWNREALDHANAADDPRVEELFPALYLDLGRLFEEMGNLEAARWCYSEARGGIGDLEEEHDAQVTAELPAEDEVPAAAPEAGPDGTPDA